jgi:hypothetical protein
MFKYFFWSAVLNGGHSEPIHRGHITVVPPIDHSSELGWFLFIIISIPFALIGLPTLYVWWDIKKHPNKPARRIAKK